MKRTPQPTLAKQHGGDEGFPLRRLWPFAVLVGLWMISSALLLDVRAGLGQGAVRGYVSVLRRDIPGSAPDIPNGVAWEIHVATAPGKAPVHRFGLFLGMIPQRLRDRLTGEGVQEERGADQGPTAPDVVHRWTDSRQQYRVEYAGLWRRVVTRVEPLQ